MCGIFGHILLDGDASTAIVERMAQVLAHRGPAGYSLHTDAAHGASIALGAGRLAIIDLEAPPGVVFNEDRSIAIAFNGEIYNHRALRAELERDGHVYRTQTDTETIVHGYEQWGDRVLERLRGMFAFALWDRQRGRLLIARDPMGEKPLYMAELGGGEFIFASEAKALFCHPRLRRAVNHAAIADFLILGYTLPPHTLFAGIHRLAPGECGVWEHGALHTRTYRQPTMDATNAPPYAQAVQQVRAALFEAVGAQMMSDVPIGAFLSGGVDSSAVVAVMRAHSDQPVNTFTVGFDAPAGSREDQKFNVDARYAREVAAALGTHHHEISIPNDARLADLLPRLVYAQDDPISLPTMVQTVYVSALARANGVPVLLNGEAGDELFLGYNHYRADQWVSRYRRLPGLLRGGALDPLLARLPGARFENPRALVHKSHLSDSDRYLSWLNIVTVGQAKQMRNGALDLTGIEGWLKPLLATPNTRHFADRMAFASLRGFVGEFNNMRVDKMCMAMSIEARSPLEDRTLVDLALRLPLAYKLRGGGVGTPDFKRVFKDAVRDLVPAAVLARPKWGFAPPASNWLRTSLRPLVDTYLSRERVEAAGIFDPQVIAALVEGHMNHTAYALHSIWSALMLQLWFAVYMDESLPMASALTPAWFTQTL